LADGWGRVAGIREIGDYDDFLAVEDDEVKEAVSRAQRFLDEVHRWLVRHGYE
jgi:hypothetical protein